MEKFHQLGQIVGDKIVRAHTGVKPPDAEINCVRAVFDGGFRAFPPACGREHFGLFHFKIHFLHSCAHRASIFPKSPPKRENKGANVQARGSTAN